MGLFLDIKNRITSYVKERRIMGRVREAKKDEEIPQEEREEMSFCNHYRSAAYEAEKMSDQEAIRNYKEKRKEYDKQKKIYDKTKEILEKNGLGMPHTSIIYDGDLKTAKYILKVKRLDIPEGDLTETEVAIEDVKSKLEGAFLGIIGQMDYYQQPKENIKKMEELFEKILKEEFGEDSGKKKQRTEDLEK